MSAKEIEERTTEAMPAPAPEHTEAQAALVRENDQPAGPSLSEMAVQVRTGALELETPITARDTEITELPYDFGVLTGIDLLAALDSDPRGDAVFGRVTNKQAFALFAKAAAKANPALDERDIHQRMTSPGDMLNGVRVALAFFRVTSRLASARIKGV